LNRADFALKEKQQQQKKPYLKGIVQASFKLLKKTEKKKKGKNRISQFCFIA
jgi:hypothetical protein